MFPGAVRPARALRVLLACVFLWFGASGPAPCEVGNDASVTLVAEAPSAQPDESARSDAAEVERRPASLVPHAPARDTATPPRETSARRPGGDIYLRNCVLLC